MIAIVKRVEDGKVTAIVRRGYREETLEHKHFDLELGDRVEVVRRTNNLYLIRVEL